MDAPCTFYHTLLLFDHWISVTCTPPASSLCISWTLAAILGLDRILSFDQPRSACFLGIRYEVILLLYILACIPALLE